MWYEKMSTPLLLIILSKGYAWIGVRYFNLNKEDNNKLTADTTNSILIY
jgi:hypothetical protein